MAVRFLAILAALLLGINVAFPSSPGKQGEASGPSPLPVVYDMDAAKEICDELPLDPIEGIWIYPQDNVTVLVRKLPSPSLSAADTYQLMVVEATDCRLNPGDVIGKMVASPELNKFTLSLFTSKKGGVMEKSSDCLATLSKDGESMVLSREKSRFRIRINLNPNSLLPYLWRSLVRFGITVGNNDSTHLPAPGMIKVYPSYD
ncbi:MAG: hypothetical protein K2M10_02520, partial [Muribaculaceae bacterium]|nr:hypothetical protein [Muribaculaceae bacterium]